MTASEARWDVIGIGENSVDSVSILPGYPQPTGPSAKMRIRERHILSGRGHVRGEAGGERR